METLTVQAIFTKYTSKLMKISKLKQQPVRYIFHSSSPGNCVCVCVCTGGWGGEGQRMAEWSKALEVGRRDEKVRIPDLLCY